MKAAFIFTLASLILIAGCVPSLHELWTEKTLVYDEAINGKYQAGDNIWEFVGNPDKKSYQLTIHEDENEFSSLVAHLVQIEDERFLDTYPADTRFDGGQWKVLHMVPAHLFFHVSGTDPNLVIAAMNPDKVGELLEEKPELVKHEVVDNNDYFVLTDSPENLQKFVLAGLKVEGFFGELEALEPFKE